MRAGKFIEDFCETIIMLYSGVVTFVVLGLAIVGLIYRGCSLVFSSPTAGRAGSAETADALAAHAVPDWVAHRLATFKAEARGLDLALKEHQKENNQ